MTINYAEQKNKGINDNDNFLKKYINLKHLLFLIKLIIFVNLNKLNTRYKILINNYTTKQLEETKLSMVRVV